MHNPGISPKPLREFLLYCIITFYHKITTHTFCNITEVEKPPYAHKGLWLFQGNVFALIVIW